MEYNELLKSVRENLNGSCKVCKVCNGVVCVGEVFGMGGKGSGFFFIENSKSLEKVKVNMRVIYDVLNFDIFIEMFGKKMSVFIFVVLVIGIILNMGGKINERDYIELVVVGCVNSGIYVMVGDMVVDVFLMENLDVVKKYNGVGIVFIKFWDNENIIKKIRLVEEVGVFVVGVDIDVCGLVILLLYGKLVFFKNVK